MPKRISLGCVKRQETGGQAGLKASLSARVRVSGTMALWQQWTDLQKEIVEDQDGEAPREAIEGVHVARADGRSGPRTSRATGSDEKGTRREGSRG